MIARTVIDINTCTHAVALTVKAKAKTPLPRVHIRPTQAPTTCGRYSETFVLNCALGGLGINACSTARPRPRRSARFCGPRIALLCMCIFGDYVQGIANGAGVGAGWGRRKSRVYPDAGDRRLYCTRKDTLFRGRKWRLFEARTLTAFRMVCWPWSRLSRCGLRHPLQGMSGIDSGKNYMR